MKPAVMRYNESMKYSGIARSRIKEMKVISDALDVQPVLEKSSETRGISILCKSLNEVGDSMSKM